MHTLILIGCGAVAAMAIALALIIKRVLGDKP